MQSVHALALRDGVYRWFTLFIALYIAVHALHATKRRRADTESRMSLAVVGLRDSENLPHECAHRLPVFVGRARLNFRPIDS